MPFLILALFIGLPIAEIAVLIKVADVIDLWPTILLIIMTAVIGVSLIRMQGLSSIQRAQTSLNEGRLPVNSITDAVALMLAGAFLLTPGLITDTLGFALLIPPLRHGVANYFFNKARSSANINVDMFGTGSHPHNNSDPFRGDHSNEGRSEGPVIDGEVIEPSPSREKKRRANEPFFEKTVSLEPLAHRLANRFRDTTCQARSPRASANISKLYVRALQQRSMGILIVLMICTPPGDVKYERRQRRQGRGKRQWRSRSRAGAV